MANARSPLAAWAGWIAGPLGWLLQHQAGSNAVFWNCNLGQPWLVVGLGAAGALIAAGGGSLSWRARRLVISASSEASGVGSHRFIGTLGALSALLFLVAILGQTMAVLFLTGCGPS